MLISHCYFWLCVCSCLWLVCALCLCGCFVCCTCVFSCFLFVGVHVLFSHYEYFDSMLDFVLPESEWFHHSRYSPAWMRQRFVDYPVQNNVWQLPKEDTLKVQNHKQHISNKSNPQNQTKQHKQAQQNKHDKISTTNIEHTKTS